MFTANREDIEVLRGWIRGNEIYAEALDNSDGKIAVTPVIPGLLRILVNDYRPADGEWDPDEFEARTSFIYAPANRRCWREAYSRARSVLKGPVEIAPGVIFAIPDQLTISETPKGETKEA